ncbi:MAG: glycosyltransferase family 2 protein [Thermoanaerobaculia bacterium]
MKIVGVSMVRNAADLIAANIRHHFHSGLHSMYVVDHASSDGTREVLERISRSYPVKWLRYEGAFLQREILTELARDAYRNGADWIVPIDSDEFWWTESGDLQHELSRVSAAAVECDVVQFIQCRGEIARSSRSLLTMTRRVEAPVGPLSEVHHLVESKRAAFVEVAFPTKWITRAGPAVEILQGAHQISGVAGPRARTHAIECLHAPLRARWVFEDRAGHGRRNDMLEANPELGWQSRRWRRIAEESDVDREWAANSYDDDDTLDVYGTRKRVVVDLRLRNCVAPWIEDDAEDSPAGFSLDGRSSSRGEPRERMALRSNGGVAVMEPQTSSMTDLEKRLAAAELRGIRARLDAALEAVAASDATLRRISESLPGRIYRALARRPWVRRLMRVFLRLG